MLQIRQHAFETNSSSTHAIVLGSGSLQRPKEIRVDSSDFGYNKGRIRCSNDPSDKVSLLIYQGYLSRTQIAKLLHDFCNCKLYIDDNLITEFAAFRIFGYTPEYFNTEQKVIDFIFNDSYTAYTFSDEIDYDEIEYNDRGDAIKINGQRVLDHGN